MDALFQRRVYACGRLALYCSVFAIAAFSQQQPDWYNQVQFLAGFEAGYYLNGGPQNGGQYANAAPFANNR